MINKKSSILSIVITSIVVLLMGSQLVHLKFNNDLDAFFPLDDPDLIYYKDFTDKFGYDNDYILIALKNDQGIFQADFLQRADSLISDLEDIVGVKKVISLVNLSKVIKTPMGFIEVPYLHLDNTDELLKDSIKVYKEPHVRDQFISEDSQSTKIILSHRKFENKKLSDALVSQVYEVMDNYQFDKVHMAGRPIGERAYVWAVQEDFSFFLIFSGATILIMLIIFIRRPSMVAASLLISLLSVVMTLSFMTLVGKEIDILSTLIPSILLVVSMSDIIHLFAHAQEAYAQGATLPDAINQTVKKVGFATFLTSVTTAVGFITLISIRVQPIIDLGMYSAVGIVFAFLLTYLLFPQMMFLIKPRFKRKRQNKLLKSFLQVLYHLVMTKQKTILITFGVAFLLVLVGISKLQINAYLIEDLPKNDPVKEDFMYFDSQYGGTKPFTMSVWTPDSAEIYSKEVITLIDSIETLAHETLNANNLVSPVTIVKSIYQMQNGGFAKNYKLPETDTEWKKVFRAIKKGQIEQRFFKVTENNLAQISGFSKDFGSRDATLRSKKFSEKLDQSLDKSVLDYRITGSSQLIEKSHETLSMNLMKGLFGAVIIVSIIAGYMFKSWRMILITLIPNLFPIMAIAAVMGFFGIPINLGTSIIFAISFGIVVDDTIHFLSKMREERLSGRSMVYAIKRTIFATGEPIIVTTIILTSGFAIFCFSQFAATFNTGLFVSVSFIVALIADLTLLPVLILYFLPRRNLGR
ncbi:MMPL family transporter [Reichenbachiella agarivorans]|uniref:MMPL family transporter n=1 Tax=Reichenbachiella agarivorans TaxID=2979464 RepID=A0ABY6CQ95_9BACT|nr:MMPL family transporter [Reichenbachiella agarivorans]UXP31964.1 MMPL family transporter [Reichenbachiella agarivorans]